jgi:hypothetical protein
MPGGNVPVDANVNVLVLPVTVMVWLYACPIGAFGNVPGLSDIVGQLTEIVYVCEPVQPDTVLVAIMVKV